MDAATINAIAAARCQVAVAVQVKGQRRWFLVDQLPCTVEDLASCLDTGSHTEWLCGELLAFDRDGRPKLAASFVRAKHQPIRFFKQPRKANTMCGRCGLKLNLWTHGWKHVSGGRVLLPCCDKAVPVNLNELH